MFEFLIIIKPLGFMYGSAGAFLSPEDLVGRSGAKFPPDAATLSGLFFSAYFDNDKIKKELKERLYTAGPFWAKSTKEQNFYVPIPKSRIIGEDDINEWIINEKGIWDIKNKPKDKSKPKMESFVTWQTVQSWDYSLSTIQKSHSAKQPWKYISFLHPEMQKEQRCSLPNDGLFLENAVQIPDDISLVYLSTHELRNGWYRFGGENHIVEIKSEPISFPDTKKLFNEKKIEYACALITPAVWGSNRISYRYPDHPDFPKPKHILTDKPIPYRYRLAGRLSRGRYAVPPGTVYMFDKPLGKSWWQWKEWENLFPVEGFSLQRVGGGLCLPIKIDNLSLHKGAA